ncbi:hypothetical protein BCV72DRAFT_139668 [Rhizopus microsporus var. microsporus]|nr:hypothetical protein BCV72DRAFT_139668 [Rhizopus microsporus var. microsporus]
MDLDDKEEEEEECDEWSSEKPVPVYYKSLSWDNFNSSSFRHQPMKTPFLTEAPLDCFESILDATGYITVKERPLVISLIQAILGLPSIYFTWDSKLKCFKSVRSLRISGVTASSIQPIIDSILTFGSHMKAIEFVAKQCQLNPR